MGGIFRAEHTMEDKISLHANGLSCISNEHLRLFENVNNVDWYTGINVSVNITASIFMSTHREPEGFVFH
jgi:hypothetical protein